MHLKKTLTALSLSLLAFGSQVYGKPAAQKTSPASFKGNNLQNCRASLKPSFGLSKQAITAQTFIYDVEDEEFIFTSIDSKSLNYQLGLEYNFGYSSWMNLRLRGSGAMSGTGSLEIAADYEGGYASPSNYALNGDAYLFFPICINKKLGISLAPTIGYGFTAAYIKARVPAGAVSVYRNRVQAPLAGLYLEIIPSDSLQMRWGCSAHIPGVKQRIIGVDENYTDLNSKRHGISSELEIQYFTGKKTLLSAKCEYASFSARDGSRRSFYSEQLSFDVGLKRVF